MLAGPDVVAATAHTFETSTEKSFVRRLIAAMKAGEAKGGDKRGKQSAALVIWTTEEYPAVSLRVDDHADPLAELERLESVGRQRLFHYVKFMPSRTNPSGTLERDDHRGRHRQGGRRAGQLTGAVPPPRPAISSSRFRASWEGHP